MLVLVLVLVLVVQRELVEGNGDGDGYGRGCGGRSVIVAAVDQWCQWWWWINIGGCGGKRDLRGDEREKTMII